MSVYVQKSEFSTWEDENKELILSQIGDNLFPCIFAKRAMEKNLITWVFCDYSDGGKNIFLKSLLDYTDFIKKTSVSDRILAPLLVVINANSENLEQQHKIAWLFVQYLIDENPMEWNNDISKDFNNHKWCLCFNNVQLFMNISASKHKELKSRNLGKDICLVINPREVFDVVAPHDKPKGLKIRNTIRDRVCKFNNTKTYPKELGFFGDENNLEWRQYQLYETGGLINENCPLSFNSKKDDEI